MIDQQSNIGFKRNLERAILQLKFSMLVGIFQKYGWRFDNDILYSLIEKHGVEEALIYVKNDQRFYKRIIHAMYNFYIKNKKIIR